MIDSAAVANQQAALTNVHYFIPLILNDRIQLSNLITVLLSRVSSNNMNSYFDGSRLANEAIEMSKFFVLFYMMKHIDKIVIFFQVLAD